MCGIVFTMNSSTYANDIDDWLKDAMLASQVRGTDSAGMFQVNQGKVEWFKNGISPTEFLKAEEVKKLIRCSAWTDATVGHVRAATMGGITTKNAHPFQADREDGSYIIMVHNGTLNGWKNKKDSENYTVDSEWMAHMLATEGADAFEYFNGAFAIVWFDSRHPKSLFMARNKERPLHYCVVNKGKSIIGCSELGMLGWLGAKHGLVQDTAESQDIPFYLEEGKIYQFSLEKIGEFTVVEYPKYDPSTSTYTSPASTSRQYNPLSPYFGSDVGDDWEGDWGSDYYSGRRSGGGSWINRQYKSDEEEQEELLTAVKAVLKTARNSPVATFDKAAIDAALGMDAPPLDGTEGDGIDCGAITLSTVNSSSATTGEIAEAKRSKVYGMVVRFSGILYEPATSCLIGTFSLLEHGSWVDYDAEMRYIPQAVAQKYTDGADKDRIVAICGVCDQYGESMMVVAELDKAQLDFIKDFEDAIAYPQTARAS